MFRILPPFGGTARQISEVVNLMMLGKTNNTGTVTLRQSETSTVITDIKIGSNSVILFMPTTADAADEMSHGHFYVSSRGKGTATITHGNHNTTMTFAYVVVG
jgi:hypothetical protein